MRTHGQVFAQLDKYFDMSMADIRALEDDAQKELSELKSAQEKTKGDDKADEKKPATS